MNDEERQLRNLDKLEYMSQYLNEDHINTKESLKAAQLIKEDAYLQMSEFEQRNAQELKELEDEVRKINSQIEAQKYKQSEIKEENQRLLKAINSARDNDFQQNQGLLDKINQQDRDFEKNEKNLQDSQANRLKDLMKYNKDCEAASLNTQKTENTLKEKEVSRYQVQESREQLEKELADLTEKNLKE